MHFYLFLEDFYMPLFTSNSGNIKDNKYAQNHKYEQQQKEILHNYLLPIRSESLS